MCDCNSVQILNTEKYNCLDIDLIEDFEKSKFWENHIYDSYMYL